MQRRLVLAVALVVVLGVTAEVQAFGTIRALGQNAEHERITRQGLATFGFEPATMDEIAGRSGTFGAVGAPDRPGRGLIDAPQAHCDNGDWLSTPGYPRTQAQARAALTACRDFGLAAMDAAVRDAAGLVTRDLDILPAQARMRCPFMGRRSSAKCNVLDNLGLALHASQDFYSHTNWVDPRSGSNALDDPPGLGNTRPAPWLHIKSADQFFPEGLISGCFGGIPERLYCSGRVRHADLNKDTPGAARNVFGMHRKAFDVAAQDTAIVWGTFTSRVVQLYGSERGARIVCMVMKDDPAVCDKPKPKA